MREYRYVLVDVFTNTPLEGNPVAVFPSADGLADFEMQKIAAEFNLSETAFILKPRSTGAARLRIFTPRRELDFAGHPTVGSAFVLAQNGIRDQHFSIEENVGLVPIDRDVDAAGTSVFWLTTPKITFHETLDRAFCARLLNLDESDVVTDAPPQFVSAGSPLLIVCLNSSEAVDRAQLQPSLLPDALGSVNSVGTFLFARKDLRAAGNFDVYSRMFAPQTGIAEDPATGGATGPLAGYMLKYGMLPASSTHFTSEQGVKMRRPSLLHVRVEPNGESPSIKVGGAVVPIAEGRFYVPFSAPM